MPKDIQPQGIEDSYDFNDERFTRVTELEGVAFPSDSEGTDGDERLIEHAETKYLCKRVSGKWVIFREDNPIAGNMYIDDDSVSITITAASTFYIITPFTSAVVEGGVEFITNHLKAPVDGIYKITNSVSFNGTASTIYHIAVYRNGSELNNILIEHEIGAGNEIGAAAASGIVKLAKNDVIDVRVAADGASKTMNANHVSLVLQRI
jgi:hypothetical protein